jgi:hypothetical protein
MIAQRGLFITLFTVLTLPPAPARAQIVPSPAPALVHALASIRGSMGNAAASIAQLSPPDRDAVRYWLASHGRGPLHARGATDAQIGLPYYAIDYNVVPAPWPASVQPLVEPSPVPTSTPTPAPARHRSFGLLGTILPELHIPIASSSSSSTQTTTTNTANSTQTDTTTQSSSTSVSIGINPWAVVGSLIDATSAHAAPQPPSVPWRSLLFAASNLGSGGSGIVVTRGFAAVRNDGTEGLACVSFANNSQKTASEIDVDIEILDSLGFIRRVAPLRLSGSFAPGAEIGGPANVQDVNSARANCVIDGEHTLANLSDPFSGAQAVVYSVRRVQYADGTQWLQPGANPWS